MTTAPAPATLARSARSARSGRGAALRWAITDALTLTRREVRVWKRNPAFIVFTVIQPVMFVLLFRYVFGGAIRVPSKGGYIAYLTPGVIGQSAAFACFGTAVALAREIKKGVIDRFRAMPMARSAVLVGRLFADALRMTVTVVILLVVSVAVGFRFHDGAVAAVAMVLLAILLGVVTCTVAAYIGLALRDEETVSSVGLIWLFPLTFVSSAFVPVQSMPGWLQAFANNQPITIVIDEMRSLAIGGPLVTHGWQSAVWLAGIAGVFVPLAVRAYRRT